ncbi:MAG TPA: BON domain-containing protein [Pirellulales bacterium]|nr:BON domain-containing protein [Pirellulales bacterium]
MLRKARTLLTGLGAGAGWMYFYDPQLGNRRRALLRDQFAARIHRGACWMEKGLRDAAHRLQGMVAEFEGTFDSRAVSDSQLVERLRASLGHVASHPRLVEIKAQDGHVTLSGHAPADEIEGICCCAAGVRGVQSVDNQLDSQLGAEATNDGRARRRVQPRLDMMRETWAPSTRLIAGSLGTALMLNCLARRTPGAVLMGTLGFGLFLRAAGNRDVAVLIEEGTEAARPIVEKMQAMTSGAGGARVVENAKP